MPEIKFTPKGKGKDSPWKGHVKIKTLDWKMRTKAIKELQFSTGDDGKVELAAANIADLADKMRDMCELCVTQVDLTFKKTGAKFKSLGDLEPYREGMEAIIEIGSALINGVELGNV